MFLLIILWLYPAEKSAGYIEISYVFSSINVDNARTATAICSVVGVAVVKNCTNNPRILNGKILYT